MIRVLTKNYGFKWGSLVRRHGGRTCVKALLDRGLGRLPIYTRKKEKEVRQ